MKIVPYDPKYKNDFIELNKRWITEMFAIEPEDIRELSNIEPALATGGQIFFAVDDGDTVLACCMIAPRTDGDWEILKFAARGMYTGTGAGSACLNACMDYARERKLERVLIVSNHKCEQAVRLYRKFGFKEIPVNKQKFPFEQANIAFEQSFN
ncbi:MAG: GNAT family N-acetyltransferase [Alphaproteobacteria bacterium]|nr:GNAT family N-acetyltransferase [Alphaproteobacteria bacterium]